MYSRLAVLGFCGQAFRGDAVARGRAPGPQVATGVHVGAFRGQDLHSAASNSPIGSPAALSGPYPRFCTPRHTVVNTKPIYLDRVPPRRCKLRSMHHMHHMQTPATIHDEAHEGASPATRRNGCPEVIDRRTLVAVLDRVKSHRQPSNATTTYSVVCTARQRRSVVGKSATQGLLRACALGASSGVGGVQRIIIMNAAQTPHYTGCR